MFWKIINLELQYITFGTYKLQKSSTVVPAGQRSVTWDFTLLVWIHDIIQYNSMLHKLLIFQTHMQASTLYCKSIFSSQRAINCGVHRHILFSKVPHTYNQYHFHEAVFYTSWPSYYCSWTIPLTCHDVIQWCTVLLHHTYFSGTFYCIIHFSPESVLVT